jgi:hypothetical protein
MKRSEDGIHNTLQETKTHLCYCETVHDTKLVTFFKELL